ncbi:MAG: hypothetical protein JF607_19700 [Burkholderiales bacterium]|jgi:hypothetical protein|nr:hypothetical protein [Burkholderiales bacterium]MBW8893020.1 hypothetical protein [Burkholderiales bacterium]
MSSSSGKFTEVNWADYSKVEIRYEIALYQFEHECKLLRVRFGGSYGYGSDGNGDAVYMDAMYRAAFEVLRPDGLILDFSELGYQWGDLLGRVLNAPDQWSERERPPFAVVLGAASEEGVRSLLLNDLGWSADELTWAFNEPLAAQAYVEDVMRECCAALHQRIETERHNQARSFWQLLGSDIGPEQCRSEGCHRLRVKNSGLCREHHYERVRQEPCPFK